MNRQEIFDTVVNHLFTQREQSVIYSKEALFSCRYRMEKVAGKTLKCAAGILIPDDEYSPEMENTSFVGLASFLRHHKHLNENAGMIDCLQKIHDEPNNWNDKGASINVEKMNETFKSFAEHYGLEYTERK